jgi:hypothetical protein
MPTPLIKHNPRKENRPKDVEPRVLTQDVAAILTMFVKPDDEDSGASVSLVAEKAATSTRTVYRVLSQSTESINLDLADRLCLACGSHLAACRLKWPDGAVTDYTAPARTTL